MKYKYLFLLLLFTAALTMPAQVVRQTTINEDEEVLVDDEEDEEGEGDEEDTDDGDELPADSLGVSLPADSVITVGGVELPEGMSDNVDALLRQWHSQQYLSQENEGEALYPAEPILADAETYTERLRRLPAGLDLPYNDIVQRFIEQYAGRLRRSVSYMLGAQNFYMPIFEEALETYGLPLELKYLPVIESALNPNAVSRVGATGLWQFMLATGKRYDLEVNSLVDDRRDPEKSSRAAARYLRDLYNIYKDWPLVIAAYNCGPGNINKAIHRAGGVQDYWEIYPYLPHETRGYVPAFIAANYIMNYYCEHGIRPMQAQLPLATDTIVVSRDLHLQQVADLCKLPLDEVKALNPQYRRDIVPGLWRPCTLRLPQESVTTFIDWGDSIYNHRASELLTRRSTVTVNDTYVPAVRSSKSSRNTRYSRSRSSSRGRSVTIRQGDTLGAIARRNGTTVAKLRRLNGISGNNIRAGKKIRVK
ncbi:MAG: transglycosylase SLT domain-containing protein [Bacteroidaceae bacterium]|nr:transglycosylase SLT domain-containing protein [Bacteroidaceae bacterium]